MNLVIIVEFTDLFCNDDISSAGGTIAVTVDRNGKNR